MAYNTSEQGAELVRQWLKQFTPTYTPELLAAFGSGFMIRNRAPGVSVGLPMVPRSLQGGGFQTFNNPGNPFGGFGGGGGDIIIVVPPVNPDSPEDPEPPGGDGDGDDPGDPNEDDRGGGGGGGPGDPEPPGSGSSGSGPGSGSSGSGPGSGESGSGTGSSGSGPGSGSGPVHPTPEEDCCAGRKCKGQGLDETPQAPPSGYLPADHPTCVECPPTQDGFPVCGCFTCSTPAFPLGLVHCCYGMGGVLTPTIV